MRSTCKLIKDHDVKDVGNRSGGKEQEDECWFECDDAERDMRDVVKIDIENGEDPNEQGDNKSGEKVAGA